VYAGILAAHREVAKLKEQRDRMIECLPERLRIDLIASRGRAQWWGDLPAHVIPPMLFCVWALGLILALT
jgi:hypothetical protein